jgi:hypothetical protein
MQKSYFKICLTITTCLLDMSTSLHTVLTAEAHVVEGQLLCEESTKKTNSILLEHKHTHIHKQPISKELYQIL